MGWFSGSHLSPIGLDLGEHSFKAVQVKRTALGWDIANSVSIERITPEHPLDPAELIRVQEVLDRRGFEGRDVIVAIPASKLLTAMLELPARAPGVPLDQIACLEFARVHKKEIGDLTMSTWELPAPARASKATYMLGVGAQSSDLESHIDLIESSGLNVVAIEECHTAAARGCQHVAKDLPGLVGVIDLGWTVATLTILRNQTIVYTRKLADAGMAALCKEAAEISEIDGPTAKDEIWRAGFANPLAASVSYPEVLDVVGSHFGAALKEVGQAFSYASHRYSSSNMSKAILIGGGATIPGIAQRFELLLGVSTVIGNVGLASSGDSSAALSSALGLALWSEEDQ